MYFVIKTETSINVEKIEEYKIRIKLGIPALLVGVCIYWYTINRSLLESVFSDFVYIVISTVVLVIGLCMGLLPLIHMIYLRIKIYLRWRGYLKEVDTDYFFLVKKDGAIDS